MVEDNVVEVGKRTTKRVSWRGSCVSIQKWTSTVNKDANSANVHSTICTESKGTFRKLVNS